MMGDINSGRACLLAVMKPLPLLSVSPSTAEMRLIYGTGSNSSLGYMLRACVLLLHVRQLKHFPITVL